MRFTEYAKRHWFWATFFTVLGVVGVIGGWSTMLDDDAKSVWPWLEWLLTDDWGKAIVLLSGLASAWCFWVGYPWAIERTDKPKLRQLCQQLDTIGDDCLKLRIDPVSSITTAGLIVRQCRDAGAFKKHPNAEAFIDVALAGGHVVQFSENAVATRAREYLVWWIAVGVAYEKMNLPRPEQLSPERIKSLQDDPKIAGDGSLIVAMYIRAMRKLGPSTLPSA